ncbi:MAG: hypothetical protein AB1921_12365 [Thermodesulfobacteriota bacterium]
MHREFWQRRVERPGPEQLRKDIRELGYVGTGRKYGVSNNAVKKRLKTYESEGSGKKVPDQKQKGLALSS